jgi:hypothetical protein
VQSFIFLLQLTALVEHYLQLNGDVELEKERKKEYKSSSSEVVMFRESECT